MNIFKKTKILKVDPKNPDQESIKTAVEVLRNGGLVAFPTETVYGLAADYKNEASVERIYKVKKRPSNKPLTLHISDMDMLKEFITSVPPIAQRLINRFWPGPLTIILMSKDGQKIGFRMPKHKVALQLIKEFGSPIVAPSANISDSTPPLDAESVLKSLGHNVDMILDGGRTDIGTESTVIDATIFPCKILREGAITKARISEAWYYV